MVEFEVIEKREVKMFFECHSLIGCAIRRMSFRNNRKMKMQGYILLNMRFA